MRGWLPLLLLVGCDSIFGLNDVQLRPDTGGRMVTGTIYQLYAHNDPDGVPTLEKVFFAPNVVTMTLETDTGSLVIPVDAAGAFAFATDPGAYRLAVQAAGGASSEELVLSSDTLEIVVSSLTRPDVQLVQNASIVFNPSPKLSFPMMVTTGIWSPSIKMTAGAGSTWVAPYPVAFDATMGDRVFAIDYVTDPFAGAAANHIVRFAAGDSTVRVTSDTPTPVPATTVEPPLSCLGIDPQFDQGLTRLTPVSDATDVVARQWQVAAFPSDEIAPSSNGIVLAEDQSGVSGTADAMVVDPFGLPPFAVSGVARIRTYLATTYGSEITEYHEVTIPDPAAGCVTVETFGTTVAPVAAEITFGGVQLAADDVQVDRGTDSLVELSWQPSAQQVDGWDVELDEVGTTTNPHNVHVILTTETSVKLASSVLVPGRSYIFQIVGIVGLPSASHGDFVSATFPLAVTSVASHPFNVL